MLATLGRDLRVSTNARGGTNESSGASPPTALGVVALAAGVIPGSPEDRSGVQGTCDAGGPDELALKADSPPAVKRLSTERTKQMYAAHRQTQVRWYSVRVCKHRLPAVKAGGPSSFYDGAFCGWVASPCPRHERTHGSSLEFSKFVLVLSTQELLISTRMCPRDSLQSSAT